MLSTNMMISDYLPSHMRSSASPSPPPCAPLSLSGHSSNHAHSRFLLRGFESDTPSCLMDPVLPSLPRLSHYISSPFSPHRTVILDGATAHIYRSALTPVPVPGSLTSSCTSPTHIRSIGLRCQRQQSEHAYVFTSGSLLGNMWVKILCGLQGSLGRRER